VDAGFGSEVTLWGRASNGAVLPIDEVAQAAGTVGYELMCALAPRVPVVVAATAPGQRRLQLRSTSFANETGGIATVFARKGDDFVRITTSVKNAQGQRNMGTLLEAGPAAGESAQGRALYRPHRGGRQALHGLLPARSRTRGAR
jgi:hypothetical protein